MYLQVFQPGTALIFRAAQIVADELLLFFSKSDFVFLCVCFKIEVGFCEHLT